MQQFRLHPLLEKRILQKGRIIIRIGLNARLMEGNAVVLQESAQECASQGSKSCKFAGLVPPCSVQRPSGT
ncbi:hypothetical protein [Paenibacillus dendritiformis]|uniref:hypothetical protein n=1 Tax=Paenibacillus dendritiformis TaxID=130049 RepID=UPI0018CC923A|nr:hypothetical protein [Paenibacillus dendritiformis]